jgi:hypothetical protein
MSYKLRLEVANEDVRFLITNVFNLGLNRFSREYQETITKLTNSFASGTSVEILESLELVVDALSSQIYELENLASIVSEIDNAEKIEEETGSILKNRETKKKQ